MDKTYELDININDNLSIHYIENEIISNVFINTKEKNLLTKSAELMTFKGMLNIIAFYTQSDRYAINEDGVILYSDRIEISDDLYLQLEDNTMYYDETTNEILSDDNYQVTLNLKSKIYDNDIEVASYSLNQSVIHLFLEIEDYKTNELYQSKLNFNNEHIQYQTI